MVVRVPIKTATFEAPEPTLRIVKEVLDELVGDSAPVARSVTAWRDRLKDLADRLNDSTLNPQDTLVLIAVTAVAAAEQLEVAS